MGMSELLALLRQKLHETRILALLDPEAIVVDELEVFLALLQELGIRVHLLGRVRSF